LFDEEKKMETDGMLRNPNEFALAVAALLFGISSERECVYFQCVLTCPLLLFLFII
jgi:hypothetical protein